MATVTIPDDVYEQLQDAATRKQRPVTDLLNEAIASVVAASAKNGTEPMTLDDEQRRIREVMKDLIWSVEDINAFFDALDLPDMSDEEAERIVAAIPPLDPSLSQTVIQMRDEERY